MKKLLITVIFFLSVNCAFATAQFGDRLIYEGKTVSIFSNPLESYFDENHPRPDNLFNFSCTACWRGYVATWEIIDNYLHLVKVVEGTCDPDAKKIPVTKIIPESKAPVRADWFTGTLRIPQGKMLSYKHMGYETVYEKELFMTFNKGKLTKKNIVDNTKKSK